MVCGSDGRTVIQWSEGSKLDLNYSITSLPVNSHAGQLYLCPPVSTHLNLFTRSEELFTTDHNYFR